MVLNEIFLALVTAVIFPATANDHLKNECASVTSCSSCIEKSFCVWCVTKSKCTKQECGNDNIIYPDNVPAILSGPSFCPRVVEPDVRTIKSGTKNAFVVKITQIHLYMVFTPWKCRVTVGDKEAIVNAVILADTVYCDPALLEIKSEKPTVNGSISVLWDYSKTLDGDIQIQVCQCDLEPECSAC